MSTGTVKWIYTPSQVVPITLTFMFNNRTAYSDAIDNTVNRFMSMDLQIQVRTGASIAAGGLYVQAGFGIYLLRTTDGSTTGRFDQQKGPNFTAGSTNIISTQNTSNPELLTVIFTPAASTTYKTSITVENLPAIFKIMVHYGAGGVSVLPGTASDFYIKYVGKYLQLI